MTYRRRFFCPPAELQSSRPAEERHLVLRARGVAAFEVFESQLILIQVQETDAQPEPCPISLWLFGHQRGEYFQRLIPSPLLLQTHCLAKAALSIAGVLFDYPRP